MSITPRRARLMLLEQTSTAKKGSALAQGTTDNQSRGRHSVRWRSAVNALIVFVIVAGALAEVATIMYLDSQHRSLVHRAEVLESSQ